MTKWEKLTAYLFFGVPAIGVVAFLVYQQVEEYQFQHRPNPVFHYPASSSPTPSPTPPAGRGQARTPKQPPTAQPPAARTESDSRSPSGSNTKRLFLQDIDWDDTARNYIFWGALTRSGMRCDSVTKALMESAGNWRVTCAPGYVYRFTFDSNGNLVGASKER